VASANVIASSAGPSAIVSIGFGDGVGFTADGACGAHAGLEALRGPIRRWCVPSAFITYSPSIPRNTIFVPSGAHAGSPASHVTLFPDSTCGHRVTCRRPDPSGRTTKMFRSRWNAICRPSGDHAGIPSPSPARHSFEPHAVI
jgi:hypothetical protein